MYRAVPRLQVYRESRQDEVLLDLDFMWAGDQEMSFVVKPVPRTVRLGR